jgi:hypothetical protein
MSQNAISKEQFTHTEMRSSSHMYKSAKTYKPKTQVRGLTYQHHGVKGNEWRSGGDLKRRAKGAAAQSDRKTTK